MCRTRVLGNVCGEEVVTGRGNLSFTTINLPKIAMESQKDLNKFFEALDYTLEKTKEQLLERMKEQGSKRVKNFKFLMGQGVWKDSDKLSNKDKLYEVLKHGSLSIGFIGLAETLVALTGKHHGESEESWKLGYEIISYMKNTIDKFAEDTKLNFTLLATPAESLSMKYMKRNKEQFGEIEHFTDKQYLTNSFHIPVWHEITIGEKIKKEAPFHELCNAGHITYVEVDGAMKNNPEAFAEIIKIMKENNIGYGSINHPIDRCPLCGFGGIIDVKCPSCGAEEQDGVKFERIRRII